MTNRSDRLIGSVEILHQLNDIWIQSKIFRSTPAGDQQSVVIGGPRLGKIRIQRKTMPRLFTVCLRPIKIVNGGQTSATLFFGKRRDRTLDLSHIRIPAKIIVLKPEIGDHADAFLTDIARFANTQNNVRASDLSSSSPFHLGLEHLARTTWCPDGEHQWFYERTTGSYRTMLAKERTPAERKHRKQLIPPSNRITKLDLAKIMNAWFGRPELVCLSPQKKDARFMKPLYRH